LSAGSLNAPVIGIAGWKKSGKTTLAAGLIEAFTQRGFRVASIKHAHHNFRIDDAETDSARHRRAGAQQVAIVSSQRWALISELGGAPEPDIAAVLGQLLPCDLVIVEGYKSAPIPKIETRRAVAKGEALAPKDPRIIAIAADHAVEGAGLATFRLDDIEAIGEFITRTLGLKLPGTRGGP
jgi:molybdopterin-guanine dinucleotide biosynthesis protein B